MTSSPKSWLASANTQESGYPLQNLLHGVFRTGAAAARCGVGIVDSVLDPSALESAGLLDAGSGPPVFGEAPFPKIVEIDTRANALPAYAAAAPEAQPKAESKHV